MRRGVVYQLDVLHREPMQIRGFVLGDEQGERACAIVGSLRGNEVQQAFICANLVARLSRLERSGLVAPGKQVLVVPCANPFSMNVQQRFWPTDGTDINRRFPGDAQGDTTQRVAAALMRIVRTYPYGIQLCSFSQSGDFLPHVRVMRQGPISDESLVLARDFGLPYVLMREPSPFDQSTLNYVWQACGTHAFSLYSRATDRIDESSASAVTEAVLRFLLARGILTSLPTETEGSAAISCALREAELVDVRTQQGAGFLVTPIRPGMRVRKGQELARVLEAFDAHVLETLVAPCDGRVFFMRMSPLVQQRMVVFRIAPA